MHVFSAELQSVSLLGIFKSEPGSTRPWRRPENGICCNPTPAPTLFFLGNISNDRLVSHRYKQRPVFQCHAASKPANLRGAAEFLFHAAVEGTRQDQKREQLEQVCEKANEEDNRVGEIKAMLRSMDDGEISVSAYDTAWVALVGEIGGGGGPQFPAALQWIVDNQLPDGSWGDAAMFTAHDRLINTLACVVALESWRLRPQQCAKGLVFLRENMWRLEEEDAEHMPIGFEIAFPSMMDIARSLDLELPYDSPALREIHEKRSLKLKRIPRDLMHEVPTTLLHSIEGMPGLDWDRLLRLQCPDGSFLFSPSSTAWALARTGDRKCLQYIDNIVTRFDGGVPNVYPVDLFEHIWAVDRLERLGISRHFEKEIKQCLDHVYRYWTEDGICWARNSSVQDVDDTAMGFRLLRLHGYDVSSDVFKNFEKDGEFFCFAGQSNQAVTGMFNLNRASQLQFPGEKILGEARSFSYRFLREKQANNQLVDKWIITKDLAGEVEYALDFPWHTSLPRVEARTFLDHYGGENDVWIGKTLYRMPYVNNNTYLELAKADFNRCQGVHREEWLNNMPAWLEECGLGSNWVTERALLEAYFLAASSIFEPERSAERLGWARSAVLVQAVSSSYLFGGGTSTAEMRQDFIREFENSENFGRTSEWKTTEGGILAGAISRTIDTISMQAATPARQHGGAADEFRKIRRCLRQVWKEWLTNSVEKGRVEDGGALLLVRTLELCACRFSLEESLSPTSPPCTLVPNTEMQRSCSRLIHLTSSICGHLQCSSSSSPSKEGEQACTETACDQEVVSVAKSMQELVQRVLQNNTIGLSKTTKQTFVTVAKSFYYASRCSPATLNLHIFKVLFEDVV